MQFKKVISVILLLLISISVCACSNGKSTQTDKISVVATIFPYYDFASLIGGENTEVMLLVPPGSDSHSYEPTPKDINAINNCDLFIYTGGEEDGMFDEILDSAGKEINTLKLLDFVSPLKEELTEGMEGESDGEYDPHIWTSVKNAKIICGQIEQELQKLSADTSYKSNLDNYISELDKLDNEFSALFSNNNTPLIFADRFPFRYFVEDYGIEYYAAFPGCASYTEPSAKTIKTLIEKAQENNVKTIFYVEGSDMKSAESIAAEVGANTALLHSCHRVTKNELDAKISYLSLMKQNLQALKNTYSTGE